MSKRPHSEIEGKDGEPEAKRIPPLTRSDAIAHWTRDDLYKAQYVIELALEEILDKDLMAALEKGQKDLLKVYFPLARRYWRAFKQGTETLPDLETIEEEPIVTFVTSASNKADVILVLTRAAKALDPALFYALDAMEARNAMEEPSCCNQETCEYRAAKREDWYTEAENSACFVFDCYRPLCSVCVAKGRLSEAMAERIEDNFWMRNLTPRFLAYLVQCNEPL